MNNISPVSNELNPDIVLKSVVFPEPFSPEIFKISPVFREKLISEKIFLPDR